MTLAHQGGWDEILFVALPVLVFVGLLWLANKRAKALGGADPGAVMDDEDSVEEHTDS